VTRSVADFAAQLAELIAESTAEPGDRGWTVIKRQQGDGWRETDARFIIQTGYADYQSWVITVEPL